MNYIDDIKDISSTSDNSLIMEKIKEAGPNAVVGVLEQVITREDGSEMFKYIGSNVTTLNWSQAVASHMLHNTDPSLKEYNNYMDRVTMEEGSKWKLETINGATQDNVPLQIFGFAIADDGAVGTTVKVVDRKRDNYDIKHLIPFKRINAAAFDKSMMDITSAVQDNPQAQYEKLKNSINDGKYALKVNISTGDNTNECAFFAKLIHFDVKNIYVDGTEVNAGDRSTDEGKTLDVRTVARGILKIDAEELAKSYSSVTGDGDEDVTRSFMSSILLLAGRKRSVQLADTGNMSVTTFTDVVVTNRYNRVELPIQSTVMTFRYSLYFT